MTNPIWFFPVVLHALGWALLHFLWQGTALAALAAVALALINRASTRYVIAVFFLTLMLATPVATFIYHWRTASVPMDSAPPLPRVSANSSVAGNSSPFVALRHRRHRPDFEPWMIWAVEAWLAGVTCFALRTAGGFVLLERMRRRQSLPLDLRLQAMCVDLQRRLGLHRAVRCCQCAWLQAPVVIGWFRPVLLLPVSALTGLSAEQLEAVIAHELAHIKRLDAFVNAYQVVVETLLFYHPAVWWLSRRIRSERENCCDDIAVALCGNPLDYARALTVLEEWRGAPAFAMAATRGPLAARIMRLLGITPRPARMKIRTAGLAASLVCIASALMAGTFLLDVAHAASFQTATGVSSVLPVTQVQPLNVVVAPVPVSPVAVPVAAALRIEAASPMAQASAAPSSEPSPTAPPVDDEKPVPAESYIEAMKSAGLKDLTVDELVSLKIQGVTPEYVRAMHELGFHTDTDEIIGMKVQGVTPDYVREMRAAGLTISGDDIIALKVQGVSAAYLHALQDAGIHPDTDELIALKVQGVTPEYVRSLHDQGIHADADDLVGLRVQGVTADYVRELHALGLKPDGDELIALRVQGVTPEYIKALQTAGLKLDADELVSAKVQGITPAFVEKVRKHGFKELDLDKLLELKNSGVLEGQHAQL